MVSLQFGSLLTSMGHIASRAHIEAQSPKPKLWLRTMSDPWSYHASELCWSSGPVLPPKGKLKPGVGITTWGLGGIQGPCWPKSHPHLSDHCFHPEPRSCSSTSFCWGSVLMSVTCITSGAIATTHYEIRGPYWTSPTIRWCWESWSWLSLDTGAHEGTSLVEGYWQDLHGLGQLEVIPKEFQWGSSDDDGVPETSGCEPDRWLVTINICL